MKKKPASVPEIPKSAAAKGKRAPQKPLLDRAVDAAKKMLKSGRVKKSAEPETEVDATTVVRRTYTRKKKTEVPAILLEGDAPAPVSASAPGRNTSASFSCPTKRR